MACSGLWVLVPTWRSITWAGPSGTSITWAGSESKHLPKLKKFHDQINGYRKTLSLLCQIEEKPEPDVPDTRKTWACCPSPLCMSNQFLRPSPPVTMEYSGPSILKLQYTAATRWCAKCSVALWQVNIAICDVAKEPKFRSHDGTWMGAFWKITIFQAFLVQNLAVSRNLLSRTHFRTFHLNCKSRNPRRSPGTQPDETGP